MGHDTILNLFFEEPNRVFKIREIAKITRIPKTTVARELKQLAMQQLITSIKKKRGYIGGYIALESEPKFRSFKKIKFLEKIHISGLIFYIEEKFYPKCLILFGSFSKGEYNKGSDIDIFVQAKEKEYNLIKFERKFGHKINLFFEEDMFKLSNELFNNIINGIKLAGYIKIK